MARGLRNHAADLCLCFCICKNQISDFLMMGLKYFNEYLTSISEFSCKWVSPYSVSWGLTQPLCFVYCNNTAPNLLSRLPILVHCSSITLNMASYKTIVTIIKFAAKSYILIWQLIKSYKQSQGNLAAHGHAYNKFDYINNKRNCIMFT